MYAYHMDYWSAYRLPVPIRKYLIRQYNKRMEETNAQNNKNNEPLNRAEKNKITAQFNQHSTQPKNIMQSAKIK